MRKLKYIPIIGEEYSDWTVISDKVFKKNSNRATYWKVRCKCGYESLVLANHLVHDRAHSCRACSKITKYKDTFTLSYMKKIKVRADNIGVEYNLNNDYMYNLLIKQDNKCALSGLNIIFRESWQGPYEQTASLDRIDNTKGYIKGNVQWVHKDINFMKGSLDQDRFIELCSMINNNCGSSKCS